MLDELDSVPQNYVPGHPIAGSNLSGAQAATDALFDNSVCVLTPTAETNELCVAQVSDYWTSIGVEVVCQTPEQHDETLALTSHIPHLLSFALVDLLSNKNGYEKYSGKGFRDMSRIASSDATVWTNILVDNAEYIAKDLRELSETLDRLAELASTDKQQLKDRLGQISTYCRNLNA